MKKLILPLLLLVAFGMLAAVESDPSAVVGYVKYPCVANGNTMLAVPMDAGFTMGSQVGISIGTGVCDAVSYFDADQTWYTTYDAGEGWEEDFPITTGTPLMVYTYSAVDFFSIGTLPAPATYDLVANGNTMVMIPLNRTDLDLNANGIQGSEVGLDMAAGPVDAVSYFNADQTWYTTYDAGEGWEEDFTTTGIGAPLMVYSYSAFTWPTRSASQIRPASNSK